MYIRVGSVLRRKQQLTVFHPQLPSEIRRKNRRLQTALTKLRLRVDTTRNEISNQPEIARMILDKFLIEKSEVCLGHQNNLLRNQQLVKEFSRLKIEEVRLQTELDMVSKRLQNIENQSRGQDNTAEVNLDAIFKEKSGDIHKRNAVIVTRFYTAVFTVLSSYTTLCGLSFVCGGRILFQVLVAVATAALISSCVNALRPVIKNGKELQKVEHAKSLPPAEFFGGHRIPDEPSNRQVRRLVWRDMLQILVISVLAAVYLVFLAYFVHK